MTYIIEFLNEEADKKSSKDKPRAIKGARFNFFKFNGSKWDTIEFTIGGAKKSDVKLLMDLLYE